MKNLIKAILIIGYVIILCELGKAQCDCVKFQAQDSVNMEVYTFKGEPLPKVERFTSQAKGNTLYIVSICYNDMWTALDRQTFFRKEYQLVSYVENKTKLIVNPSIASL
jgi:hypothetical protein